jgi:hypothetical protein
VGTFYDGQPVVRQRQHSTKADGSQAKRHGNA